MYVGVPASSSSAGSGYITPDALAAIISSVGSQPNFGGVMMWYVAFLNHLISRDAVRAFANVDSNGVHYAQSAKNALLSAVGSGGSSSGTQATTTKRREIASTETPSNDAATLANPTTAAATTLQTVTQGTMAGTGGEALAGVAKLRVTQYFPSFKLF